MASSTRSGSLALVTRGHISLSIATGTLAATPRATGPCQPARPSAGTTIAIMATPRCGPSAGPRRCRPCRSRRQCRRCHHRRRPRRQHRPRRACALTFSLVGAARSRLPATCWHPTTPTWRSFSCSSRESGSHGTAMPPAASAPLPHPPPRQLPPRPLPPRPPPRCAPRHPPPRRPPPRRQRVAPLQHRPPSWSFE